MTKPILKMLIGLPGAGKSTYIKNNYSSFDGVVLSTDSYIENKAIEQNSLYSDVFKDYIKEAEQNMLSELRYAIKNNENIIWDQTNLTIKSRRKKLNMIPDIYFKEAIVFSISNKELIRRIEKREKEEGKHIPFYILQNMKKSFEMPTKDEGFDVIQLI